jgi:hypothetical protein
MANKIWKQIKFRNNMKKMKVKKWKNPFQAKVYRAINSEKTAYSKKYFWRT